jgi:hypothetical protein
MKKEKLKSGVEFKSKPEKMAREDKTRVDPKMGKMGGSELGAERESLSAKKAPMVAHGLPHKGMKAPRPASHELGDVREAPESKPSMNHKEPAHAVGAGDQSKAPSSKKAALPMQDAPEGVKGVNGGMPHALGKVGRDQV